MSDVMPNEVYKEYDASSGYYDGQVVQNGTMGHYVKTYRCKYSKKTDVLIAREFEARSSYMTRDRVIAKVKDKPKPDEKPGTDPTVPDMTDPEQTTPPETVDPETTAPSVPSDPTAPPTDPSTPPTDPEPPTDPPAPPTDPSVPPSSEPSVPPSSEPSTPPSSEPPASDPVPEA